MERLSKNSKNRIQEYWLIVIWVGMWISNIFVDYGSLEEPAQSRAILYVTVALLATMLIVFAVQKDSYEMAVTMILLISVWLRFTYCIKMGYYYSNHDLGVPYEGRTYDYCCGHIGYFQYIFHNKHLPDMDPRTVWSYYNPPFFYIVSAIFLKVNRLFMSDMRQMLENLQLLTMLFATLAIQTGYKILKEFHIHGIALVFGVAILAFHPYFIIGGAIPNNDILSVLFIFLTVLYTIRWYKQGKLRDIVKIALCIGFGMMTKQSVGLIALPVAFLFLVKFIKERQWKRYLLQFLLFGVICIPVGMYWSVRNMYLFDMPLVYVQELPPDNNQKIEGVPADKRINPFSTVGYKDPYISFDPEVSYNVWTALFKTAVFDERNNYGPQDPYADKAAWVVLITWIVLLAVSLVSGIYVYFVKKQNDIWSLLFKSLIMVAFLASYIKFCFGYPVVCSMNFRYVVPILLVVAINIGLFLEDKKPKTWIRGFVIAFILAFSISSFYLYGIIRF